MSESLSQRFGAQLRRHRGSAGLTQEGLAEHLKVTPEYISNLERGVSTPSFALIDRIARALGIQPGMLFTESHPRIPHAMLFRIAEELDQLVWLNSIHTYETYYASPSFARVMGVDPEELREDARRFLDRVHEEDRNRVAAEVERAAATGEYETEYRVQRPDGSIRWIRARGRLIDAEEGLFGGIATDITDRKRAEQELRSLVQYMGHEARNAATAIIGMLRIGSGQRRNTPKSRWFDLAINALNDLVRFTDDVLARAALEQTGLEILPEAIDSGELIGLVIGLHQALGAEKGIELVTEGPALTLYADRLRLTHVLTNLVGNAVKHIDSGRVTVQTKAGSDGFAEIVVSDTGPGIAAKELERVLGNASVDGERLLVDGRRAVGTGLGLQIARSLSSLMGGNLSATSRSGRGSTFTLRIPEAGDASIAGPRAPKRRRSRRSVAKKAGAILVVEDTAIPAIWVRSILEERGHRVQVVSNAAEALKVAANERIELAVIDVRLPDADGVQLAEELRGVAGAPLPVVIVTALVDDGIRRRCDSLESSELLLKPFETADLFAAIDQLLSD